jgi:hypothetical protein
MSKFSKLIAATLLAFASLSASADTGVVNFSFDGIRDQGGTIVGKVTGEIFGLNANGANQQATSIVITSYPTDFQSWFVPWWVAGNDVNYSAQLPDAGSVTFAANTFTDNSFTLNNGVVTSANVYADNGYRVALNWFGYNFFSTPTIQTGEVWQNQVSYLGGTVENSNGFGGVTYSALAPVPEPETYAMMLAGLGLMGFMVRRRKNEEA